MRITTQILAAGAFALSTSTAMAGGLSPEIIETPPPLDETGIASDGSSVNSTYVILGVLAALLIAAAVNANDDDDDDPVAMEVEPVDTITETETQ